MESLTNFICETDTNHWHYLTTVLQAFTDNADPGRFLIANLLSGSVRFLAAVCQMLQILYEICCLSNRKQTV